MTAEEAPRVPQYDLEAAAALARLSDEELVAGIARKPAHVSHPMEMQRRLVRALKESKDSADEAARRLLAATCVLVALTVVIVLLTVALLADAL